MLQAIDGTDRNTLNGFFDASWIELAQNNIIRVRMQMNVTATQK